MVSSSQWLTTIAQYNPDEPLKVICVDDEGLFHCAIPSANMKKVELSEIFKCANQTIPHLTQDNVKDFYKGLKKIYLVNIEYTEHLDIAKKTLNDIKDIRYKLLPKSTSKKLPLENSDKITINECLDLLAVLSRLPETSYVRKVCILLNLAWVTSSQRRSSTLQSLLKEFEQSFELWEGIAQSRLKNSDPEVDAILRNQLYSVLFDYLKTNKITLGSNQLPSKTEFAKFLQNLKKYAYYQQPCITSSKDRWDMHLSFIKHFISDITSIRFNIESSMDVLKWYPDTDNEILINKHIQAALVFMHILKNEFGVEKRDIDKEKNLLQQLLNYEVDITEFEKQVDILLETYRLTHASKYNEMISIADCQVAIKTLRLLPVDSYVRRIGLVLIGTFYGAIIRNEKISDPHWTTLHQFYMSSYSQLNSKWKTQFLNKFSKNNFLREQTILDDNRATFSYASNHNLPNKRILKEFIRKLKEFVHHEWHSKLGYIKRFVAISFFNIESRMLNSDFSDEITDRLQKTEKLLRNLEKCPLIDDSLQPLIIKYLNFDISTVEFDKEIQLVNSQLSNFTPGQEPNYTTRLTSIKKSIGDSSTTFNIEVLLNDHDSENDVPQRLRAIESLLKSSSAHQISAENIGCIKQLLNLEISVVIFWRKIAQSAYMRDSQVISLRMRNPSITQNSIQHSSSNYETRLSLIKKSIEDSSTIFTVEALLNEPYYTEIINERLELAESTTVTDKTKELIKQLLNLEILVDDFKRQINQLESLRASQINSPRGKGVINTSVKRSKDKGKDKVDESEEEVNSSIIHDQQYKLNILNDILNYIPDIQFNLDKWMSSAKDSYLSVLKNFLSKFKDKKNVIDENEKYLLTQLLNFEITHSNFEKEIIRLQEQSKPEQAHFIKKGHSENEGIGSSSANNNSI